MQNVSMKVVGTKLLIEVDLSQTQGASKSGKSEIVATTSGIVPIPGSKAKVGLNVFNPR